MKRKIGSVMGHLIYGKPSGGIAKRTFSTASLAGGRTITCDVANDGIPRHTVIMIRTQISLSEMEYNAAKREARRLGISMAELLRRSLRATLPAHPRGTGRGGDRQLSLTGSFAR